MNNLKLEVLNKNTEGLFNDLNIINIENVGPYIYWNENSGKDECSAIKIHIIYEDKLYYVNIYSGIGARINESSTTLSVSDTEIDFSDFPVKVWSRDKIKGSIIPNSLMDKIILIRNGLIDSDEEETLCQSDEDYIHGLATELKNVSKYIINLEIDRDNPEKEKFLELEEIYLNIKQKFL